MESSFWKDEKDYLEEAACELGFGGRVGFADSYAVMGDCSLFFIEFLGRLQGAHVFL